MSLSKQIKRVPKARHCFALQGITQLAEYLAPVILMVLDPSVDAEWQASDLCRVEEQRSLITRHVLYPKLLSSHFGRHGKEGQFAEMLGEKNVFHKTAAQPFSFSLVSPDVRL